MQPYIFSEFTTDALFSIGDLSSISSSETGEIIGLYTFIWATTRPVQLVIDGVPVVLEVNQIVSLTPNQHVAITKETEALVYQFNRAFYCIKDHDQEVSCAGLLFFGATSIPIITLSAAERAKYTTLHELFIEEMQTRDTIQAEMLRMLLARFIIKTTRLLKIGAHTVKNYDASLSMYRAFNVLVETHFKEAHKVTFYAEKLFKSPKTLSNNFARYKKRPLQIIHDRIILEAKRQLTYTNKTTKEIAFDLGFDDPSHLSRMFKKQTHTSPTKFRQSVQENTSTAIA